ncbi:MAG TPA: zf-HC2 domain-containing protein [Ktedonobacteraceae bacterium]
MNNTDLPPLPSTGMVSQEICDAVSLYLAVSHDLTEDQKQRVSAHLKVCPQCVREYRLVKRSAQLVSSLEGSEPSARVDVAVMAAIAARTGTHSSVDTSASLRSIPYNRNVGRNKRRRVPIGSLVAAAAVLVVALVGVLHFVIVPGGSASAFQVPAGSWNGVIYHTQTVVSSNGDQYHVATYHDMNDDMMNVETTMGTKLDVMAVSDGHQTLVMDMKHNVMQMNANAWLTDDSMFDLNQLNKDLKSHRATYLGTGQYNGQEVYRIRENGEILLLDMHYKPVNVLQDANGSGTGKAVYDKMQLLDKAPTGMMDMTPPSGFKTGTLPAKP